MTKKVLFWRKGNAKIFTRNEDAVEKALKEGKSVTILKEKTKVYK